MMDSLRRYMAVPGGESLGGTLKRHRRLWVIVLYIVIVTIYWSLIASDRYVSKASLVVDRTDFSSQPTLDFSSILTGSKSTHDLNLLKEHLLSVDMMEKLDARLHLRAHYSDSKYDFLSRMWFADGPQEWFYSHYLSRVAAEVDELAAVLRLNVQAFTPEMAHSIASALVEEGEQFMNEMVHRLARDQVAFLETQVSQMNERLLNARKVLLDYQNAKGLISPQTTAENYASIIGRLEGQLSDLKTRRQAMLGYLNPNVPAVSQLELQIKALEKQLKEERARLASPQTQTLNAVVDEFQRLQMEAEFAQDLYRTALTALEKGRVEAIRTLKKVSILQSPTEPQYPLEPQRTYNIVVYTLSALAVAGIVALLAAIIRDHKD